MTREETIQQIYDLYERAKKTDFGQVLIGREDLEKHLAPLDHSTLAAMRRFFRGLLDGTL